MPSINETFGEYRKDKPFISFDLPGSMEELFTRLAAEGIPLAHTVSEYMKNPDAPKTEIVQNLTDEFVPFKGQIRSGDATPGSLAKEAVLMFTPTRGSGPFKQNAGKRRTVRVDKNGMPNMQDLHDYISGKESQISDVRDAIASRSPVNQMETADASIKFKEMMRQTAEEDLQLTKEKMKPGPDKDELIAMYEAKIADIDKAIAKERAKSTESAINSIGYEGRTTEVFDKNFKPGLEKDGYIYRTLLNEYGPKLAPEVLKNYIKATTEGNVY